MSASVLALPATLNGTTLDLLLREAHDLYYPAPTAGFTARVAALLTIVAGTVLLALFYLCHHLYTSYRDTKTVWFVRLIERPSGRFIVLNPRVTWSLAIVAHGSFVLVVVTLFWQIYAREYSKRTYIALKTLQPLPQFVGGWIGTWSSLQAFLVASESANSVLVPAWLANIFFLVGGLVLALPDLVLAIINSHLALRLDDRYWDLVDALRALDARLAGQTPTLPEIVALKRPAAALLAAAETLKRVSLAQYCVTIMLPVACLVVNAGGLALARKIHVHIRETSVSLIALHSVSVSSAPVPPPPPPPLHKSHSLALVPMTTTTDGLRKTVSRGEGDEVEKVVTRDAGVGAVGGGGGVAIGWAQAQGRKVAELKKAKRDLILVTTTILFICVLLIGDVSWLMVGVAKGKLVRGDWRQTELSSTLDKWILFTVTFCALVYMNWNALALHRGSGDVERLSRQSRRDVAVPTEVFSLPVLSSAAHAPDSDDQADETHDESDTSEPPHDSPKQTPGELDLELLDAYPRLRPQVSSTRLGTPRSSWFALSPTPRRSRPVSLRDVRITVETEEVADAPGPTLTGPS